MQIVFCDSNSELWFDKLKKYPIKLIKMPYTIDGTEYFYDMGENTDFAGFFAKVRAKIRPITSALNEQNYIDYFKPYFENGDDILYISFSSYLSSTFDSMQKAVDKLSAQYPNAKFVRFDSQNICISASMVVEYAGEQLLKGKSNEELVALLTEFVKKVNCFFAVDDLMFLKNGGRLSGGKAFFGSLLNIKPILEITGGKIVSVDKAKGRVGVIKYFINKLQSCELDENYPIYVGNADCPEEADKLVAEIRENFPNKQIEKQMIGPVITSHCGPGTLGIAYIKK